ncbi:MAG: type VI secretion system-associated FHA domain protein TagH [Pseudomonadales bacterium]|nr:type VI secretion system-associated FHA domain protein TagH [Pseudomonadales bacterium]MDP7145251.1 type VI secretion system-associated FHA domain protein TagH [Pseudomonadales bacterium]MDP7358343.1 type VI secretion system-associated FHA domain protein TagH [Pseudomonadales bacterium]MDP7596857.1 type VI secretion system-associated FHA domain protein TagH [Pseudomonadales bacterium]HJN51565.1 type VI secretion system-associated FHA domain protein TagH [Pseudomonadales bacterium]
MSITLACISNQDNRRSGSREIELGRQGGTIGRAADNDFVVDDPERFASNHHCRIFHDNRGYCIEDTSSNGTVVNNEKELFRGQTHVLQSGDILTIGDCIIEIEVQPEASRPEPSRPRSRQPRPPQRPAVERSDEGFDDLDEEPLEADPIPRQSDSKSRPSAKQTDLSIDEAFSFSERKEQTPKQVPEPSPGRRATAKHGAEDIERAPAAKQKRGKGRATPPRKERPAPARKERGAPAKRKRGVRATPAGQAAKQPRAAPSRKEKAPPASDQIDTQDNDQIKLAFFAFLSELDMEPQQLTGLDEVEFMHMAGKILRILTDGMMEILKARGDVKKSFRMDTTKIKGVQNNALKFSGSPEEAIYRMLTMQPGFLEPLESVDEAVQDAKAHQIAMVSGMNAAIHSVLLSFDPKKLEETLDQGFAIGKKAKYWDRYIEKYTQIAQDSERNFNDLFAEAFRHSYEEQVRRVEDEEPKRSR